MKEETVYITSLVYTCNCVLKSRTLYISHDSLRTHRIYILTVHKTSTIYSQEADHLFTRSRPSVHKKPTVCSQEADHLFTKSRPSVHKKPTICSQEADHMFTRSRPYVHKKPTIYRARGYDLLRTFRTATVCI